MRGRKLTVKEQYEKIISKVMARLDSIAETYGQNEVKIACHRYANQVRSMSNLKKRIQENEKEIADLSKKMNNYKR